MPLSSSKISFLLVFCFLTLLKDCLSLDEERKIYIVLLASDAKTGQSSPSSHFHILEKFVDRSFVRKSLVRSYTRTFNGFAANLTQQEQEQLAKHEDVVSIFPSITYYPQTTRSWDFIGLAENVRRNLTVESDIIVGFMDTGIAVDSESFSDKGFSPPPKKWKGACRGGQNFTCNNKVIGARVYISDVSAYDTDGHGSHTASTAAGNYVKGASFYGIAEGTARGAVPSARIAAYKVCGDHGCKSSVLMAAFDDAIADGVDIISISLGFTVPQPLIKDAIAQAALHAAQKGILVVQAAGNNGRERAVSSTAPWIFSVGASSTDRGIITKVALGNGTELTGKTVDSFSLNGTSFPLAYGVNVSSNCSLEHSRQCWESCLEPSLVKGKILLCDGYDGIDAAFTAGATGSIAAYRQSDVSYVAPVAASGLQDHDFHLVQSYYNSTKNPTVNILKSEITTNFDAPRLASFSAKGPNFIIPDILKPDIVAPGIEILAAYSQMASPSESVSDQRRVKYNVLSGTSMSCPHVSGAAAYVKSFHPDWSGSAIKSALMTTARQMDPQKDPLAEFAYGAGFIDPVKALDPGLVYETPPQDYIKMLCSLGDETARLTKMFEGNVSCVAGEKPLPKDINYPSMTSHINTTKGDEVVAFSEKFTRTVTNVGPAKSTYKAITSSSPDYKITVEPNILSFGALNEKQSFTVMISGKTQGKMVSASLEWSDGVHRVRSPIVLYADDL